jgi:hypothetical protein
VRVGIDVSDWWIRVSLDGLRDDDAAALSRVREALLLVGAFAQLNRDCCLQYLQTFSLWHRAPFMDLDDTRFLPRFRLNVSDLMRTTDASSSDFHVAVGALLGSGDEGTSGEFVSDWARVLDMQERVGRALVDLQPVEVFLEVDVLGISSESQPMYFHCLTEAIRTVQAAQHERRLVAHYERMHMTPFLSISAMDLTLSRTELTLPTIEELRSLVELGVPLNNVELPAVSEFLSTPSPDATWRLAWCELLRAITDPASTGMRAEPDTSRFVRRLIVPSECLRGPLLSSLFSALVFARGVSELQLGRLVSRSIRHDEEGEGIVDRSAPVLQAIDPNFWYWLACLLLPDVSLSTRPIETVSLLGARIQEAVMGTLESIARSRPAIQHAVKALAPELDIDQLPLANHPMAVSICAGTKLRIHEINGSKDVITMKALTGRMFRYRRESSPALLIVPGLGVCSVVGGSLPIMRARPANVSDEAVVQPMNVALKNLKFISPWNGSQPLPALKQFVRLVGSSLEGLHVSTARMTHTTVSTFLQTCPQLESLSVGGARISSLDFLWDAYARGCKISSLELANGASSGSHHVDPRLLLDTTAVEALLYQLMPHQTACSRTLTHLSFAGLDLDRTLCPLLDGMLAQNQSLTHFWFVDCRSNGFSTRWTHERHHGEIPRGTPIVPLDRRQRLAFLSVLRNLRHGSDAWQLDSFVGSSIFQFAGTRQRRSVVSSVV